jgi:N-acetylneuraminate synthase
MYPTDAENIGLNVVGELREKFNLPVGLSDHSGKIYPSLAAAAIGAEILEFHAVFDRRMFGPDSKSSLVIDEIKELVDGVRFIDKSTNSKIDKSDNSKFKDLKGIFEKSLSVNKDMKEGDVIKFEDLEAKKPAGRGISAKNYQKVIGKKLKKDLNKWDFLLEEDIYG